MGAYEAEVDEDLVEVKDSWFATIAKGQDTMPMISLIQCIPHASIHAIWSWNKRLSYVDS